MVILGGHGTKLCWGQERCDGTGVQHFQCRKVPAGRVSDGLSVKQESCKWTWEVKVGRITVHATFGFSLRIRNVSTLLGTGGHVRSARLLTDGVPRQASNLKMAAFAATQFRTFSLSAAPKLVQGV